MIHVVPKQFTAFVGDRRLASGPLAEVTAYLTGRPHRLTTAGGEPAPVRPAWL